MISRETSELLGASACAADFLWDSKKTVIYLNWGCVRFFPFSGLSFQVFMWNLRQARNVHGQRWIGGGGGAISCVEPDCRLVFAC